MRRAFLIAAVAALVGTGAAAAIRASGLAPFKVVSGSMAPTIGVGDWVLESDGGEPRRGDIVLFRYPFGSSGRAVKRVLAVAGDTVAFSETRVTVNGRTRRIAGSPVPLEPARGRAEKVPAGHVFLLGDNTAGSYDSRGFGPAPEREIVGRVRLIVPKQAGIVVPAALLVLCTGLILVAYRRRAH